MKLKLALASVIGLTVILVVGVEMKVLAASQFRESAVVTYNVKQDGTTDVIHKIDLVNGDSLVYASGFTLTLDGYVPSDVEAYDKGGKMAISQQIQGQRTILNFTFNDMAVGKGNDYAFTITYSQSDIAKEKGQVWEVIVPEQADAKMAENYTLNVSVPKSFGNISFVSPSAYSSFEKGGKRVLTFDKKVVTNARVILDFGPVQILDFNLKYHLRNDGSSLQKRKIALPADTTYQRVMFDGIEPVPDSVGVDKDGNWLATYYLVPSERLDIESKGSVEISAVPLSGDQLTDFDRQRYLAGTRDWQVSDTEILQLGTQLKSARAIYDFVVEHLKYNYGRATAGVVTPRLGAKEALRNPDKAICTEFTDLFIALARAAAIPAREVEGYAYANDSQLQPLSLLRDVLHAWPEYWDDKQGRWVQIDPTWANTTGGVDFFSKLDFNHFAFVVHGSETSDPKPAGAYRVESSGKDVEIRFGPQRKFEQPQMELSYKPSDVVNFPFSSTTGMLVVKNVGRVSISGLQIDTSGSDFSTPGILTAKTVPPYGETEFPVVELGGDKLLRSAVWILAEGTGQRQVEVGMGEVVLSLLVEAVVIAAVPVLVFGLILWHEKLKRVYFGLWKRR